MTLHRVIYCVILCLILHACSTKQTCPKSSLVPIFIGYNSSQIDTILMLRYEKGSNLTQIHDSILLTETNCTKITDSDTSTFFIRDNNQVMRDQFDYRLINTFDNKTTTLSNLTFRTEEQRVAKYHLMGWGRPFCSSPITSFTINGVETPTDVNTVIIHR